jgi:hypothetical protein
MRFDAAVFIEAAIGARGRTVGRRRRTFVGGGE